MIIIIMYTCIYIYIYISYLHASSLSKIWGHQSSSYGATVLCRLELNETLVAAQDAEDGCGLFGGQALSPRSFLKGLGTPKSSIFTGFHNMYPLVN